MPPDDSLAAQVQAGDVRAVARAISLIEDNQAEGRALVRRLYPRTGRALCLGVTGPPGAGKSTLVDRLTRAVRAEGKTVGVIAVDPSSPFSGGALLGDRIRFSAHAGDEGVFVRSMATRGQLGGLAGATGDAVLVLDAAGRDVVIVETVGVGQDEVDIVRLADVSVVVLVPGTGDDVQALKAGIMEIADIFVVNKADREGADGLVAAVAGAQALQETKPRWQPPILKTEATRGTGVAEVWAAIRAFEAHAAPTRGGRTRARHEFQLRTSLARAAADEIEHSLPAGALAEMLERVDAREIDPQSAAVELVQRAREGRR